MGGEIRAAKTVLRVGGRRDGLKGNGVRYDIDIVGAAVESTGGAKFSHSPEVMRGHGHCDGAGDRSVGADGPDGRVATRSCAWRREKVARIELIEIPRYGALLEEVIGLSIVLP